MLVLEVAFVTLGFAIFALILLAIYRVIGRRNTVENSRKKANEFIIAMGLIFSAVLDPATKSRTELTDKNKNKKPDSQNENQ